MKHLLIFAAVVLFFSATALPLNDTPESIVTQILDNNTDIRALKASSLAEIREVKNNASDFEPTQFEYEHLFARHSSKWNIGVSQAFRWPSVYRAIRSEAANRTSAMQYLLDAKRIEIASEAYRDLEMLDFIKCRISLLDSVDNNLASLQKYVNDGYNGGQLTILDVKKITLERYRLSAQIADLKAEALTYSADLEALNNGPLDLSDVSFNIPMLLPLDDYISYATENNPEIIADRYLAAAAADNAAAQRNYPGFSVGYRHAYEENTHFNGFSLGISLPVFSRKKTMDVARLRAEAIAENTLTTRSRLTADIRAAHAEATARLAQLKNLSQFTLVENYPDLMLMAYKGGQINVITYIQELNYYLNAQMDLLAARHAYKTAALDLIPHTPRP